MLQKLGNKEIEVFREIRNRLVHGLEAPTVREIAKKVGKSSPRSGTLILERLEKAGLIRRKKGVIELVSSSLDSNHSISVVDVPLVGTVSAGIPILAEENIEAVIPVSTAVAKKGSKYFLLRISGNSMNQARVGQNKILDGSIVLVRQQPTANVGEIVVALINDEATTKVLDKKDGYVILRPKSSHKSYKPIVLSDNCIIQGVVVAVLPNDLN